LGATLANGGVNPVTGVRALQSQYVKYLLSVMLSCGMYDYAGEWVYTVGLVGVFLIELDIPFVMRDERIPAGNKLKMLHRIERSPYYCCEAEQQNSPRVMNRQTRKRTQQLLFLRQQSPLYLSRGRIFHASLRDPQPSITKRH